MANGDSLYVSQAVAGNGMVQAFNLLDAQEAAAAGKWVKMAGAISGSVRVSGLGVSDGVTLYSHVRQDWNSDPTDSDDHEPIGSEITADGAYTLSASELACTDMKCDKTTDTTADPTTVTLFLVYPR